MQKGKLSVTNGSHIFVPKIINLFNNKQIRSPDSQQPARNTISIATTRQTIGPITIWKFTWHAMPPHALASCHYEVGFSSPDTSTCYSISTKFSDIWTHTIGTIAIRLSSRTIIYSFLSHWMERRRRAVMQQQHHHQPPPLSSHQHLRMIYII
jgi:hypothetical protein